MTDTTDSYTPDAGTGDGSPSSVAALLGGAGTTETPNVTPLPSGSAPARPKAPRKTAGARKASKRTAKRATAGPRPSPSAASVADAIADAAATATAPGPRGPGRPSKVEVQSELSREALRDLYIGLGAGAASLGVMFKVPRVQVVGVSTMRQADACSAALVAWADVNPMVRRALETFKSAGGFALVAAAHAPIFVAAVTGVEAPPPEDGDDPAAGIGMLADVMSMFSPGGLAGFDGSAAAGQ